MNRLIKLFPGVQQLLESVQESKAEGPYAPRKSYDRVVAEYEELISRKILENKLYSWLKGCGFESVDVSAVAKEDSEPGCETVLARSIKPHSPTGDSGLDLFAASGKKRRENRRAPIEDAYSIIKRSLAARRQGGFAITTSTFDLIRNLF